MPTWMDTFTSLTQPIPNRYRNVLVHTAIALGVFTVATDLHAQLPLEQFPQENSWRVPEPLRIDPVLEGPSLEQFVLAKDPVSAAAKPPVGQAVEPAKEIGESAIGAKGSLTEEDVGKLIEDYWKKKKEEADEKAEEEKQKEDEEKAKKAKAEEKKEKKWYEKLSFRGYTQVRFNQEIDEEEGSAPANYVGDRSISEDQSFLIRRARLILFGDVNDYLYLYFQPDFANNITGVSDQNHFVQVRDLYADVYLDKTKEFRFRVGQSKMPYGWENLQSSQNRVPLDRADSLNSALRNERDLGVVFYYTPKSAQHFFKSVTDEGLKGSGNYGLFAIGGYNGQGGSLQELNDRLHFISRITLPYKLATGQYVEAAVQGYVGEYTVLSSPIRRLGGADNTFRPEGTFERGDADGWNDKRIATTFVWYPQPLGFQTEWTVGRGPALSADQSRIEEQDLKGGYAMFLYKWDHRHGTCFPFVRWAYYQGGYKSERNAPYTEIDEWEMGNEWQINSAAELTLSYLITDRTNTTNTTPLGVAPYGQFDGQVLRCQFQFNY